MKVSVIKDDGTEEGNLIKEELPTWESCKAKWTKWAQSNPVQTAIQPPTKDYIVQYYKDSDFSVKNNNYYVTHMKFTFDPDKQKWNGEVVLDDIIEG